MYNKVNLWRCLSLPHTMENVLVFVLLLGLKTLLALFETLSKLLVGWTLTRGWKEEELGSTQYEKSAHVVRILFRASPNIAIPHTLNHFLYVHENYMHPKFILENSNVSLYIMEKNYAVFAITEPSVDVYDTKKHPFLFISHYLLANTQIDI